MPPRDEIPRGIAVDLRIVEEPEITEDVRNEARLLLIDAFGESALRGGIEAWTQIRPSRRVLAFITDHLVGQIALVDLRAADPAVTGLSDLVVAPLHRGRGIGRAVIEAGVAEAARVGAEVTLVATEVPPAVHVFRALGFESSSRFAFYYERDDRCTWNRAWLETRRRGRARLAPIKIVGDF